MSTHQIEWEVLNPKAENGVGVKRAAPAQRVADLNNKRIGLYWNTKPNGDLLLTRLGEILEERFENLKLIKWFPGKMMSGAGATPEAIRKIAEGCDLVIASTGD